jgi:hypothetical protein
MSGSLSCEATKNRLKLVKRVGPCSPTYRLPRENRSPGSADVGRRSNCPQGWSGLNYGWFSLGASPVPATYGHYYSLCQKFFPLIPSPPKGGEGQGEGGRKKLSATSITLTDWQGLA